MFFRHKSPAPSDLVETNISPEDPLYIIGDIHGEKDQLDAILAQCPARHRIVVLGDMIDRGPDSCDVLIQLFTLEKDGAICLLGNHEEMMLNFLDNPLKHGPTWMTNGGEETLTSFGLSHSARRGAEHPLVNLANNLRNTLPEGLENWLRTRPVFYENGNIICIHAALTPNVAPEKERIQTLLWGNPDKIMKSPRKDGRLVVHGHIPQKEPTRFPGRIALDTGAGKRGRLSAAVLNPNGDVEFVHASSRANV